MFLFLFKWKGRISGKHTSSGLRGQLMSIYSRVSVFCIRVRRTLSSHNASPPISENWYWLSVREKNFWEGGGKGRE